MTAAAANALGGTNVAAFLDMLAVSEGTDIPSQRSRDRGYDVIVGGQLFTDYRDHPRVLVSLPRYGIKSSAAGRYQFLRSTWDDLRARLVLPDFGPVSQDRAAVALLKQCGAYELIRLGRFDAAVTAARRIWASLPGAGYGQKEHALETLRAAYRAAGGALQ
ncbi:TPA: glycoside hydrolase family 104 protein [Stenotrophomonas maltophilia]|uniref:glycoside hydrolase family 24 protein n=1 Tax=Stenotrophomonas TaxID=40323 RepID=UPI00066CCA85|nr:MULTISPECIES: glycoside hydrolase family 104 protein [Stenotrophomonas]HBZ8061659.1 glycoside hydrolase family 104 protein [Klebsiella pneumoniae]EKT4100364.1 glycoside hydrolase family 104 protein [Stenotrophomonas maltophilia]MBA0258937.1 glycoside hydrolase [Stenotrophomonas maltophilia]MBA0316265.1 glycoside hydrolase [Stenotrophomonas maltophilia]MBB1135860.1 glycoside hydrolase family 104 protein [Stenotrophomonas sp. I18B00994]